MHLILILGIAREPLKTMAFSPIFAALGYTIVVARGLLPASRDVESLRARGTRACLLSKPIILWKSVRVSEPDPKLS